MMARVTAITYKTVNTSVYPNSTSSGFYKRKKKARKEPSIILLD